VTGAGTSGKLAKFSDTNTIADGPVVGTTFTDSKWCQFTTANGLQCDQNTPAGAGDVTGGATSADGELAAYNGTGGKTIKQSYIAFSGPSTSVKTKTISNANDTIAELGQANTFSAKQTFGDASVNTSLQVMLTAGTNLNNQLLARDPSDNKVKTVLDPSMNSVRAVSTITAGGDASANSMHASTMHASGSVEAQDGSMNASLRIPLTATTGSAGAHNTVEDASAQFLLRSAVDNKVKAIDTYAPMYRDVSANFTLSRADTQSIALVIDVSTTSAVDISINLPAILGRYTGCQFQGGIVNIIGDASGSLANNTSGKVGFASTDGSTNLLLIDASGNSDSTGLYKNVYVQNPSNEMVIAFWGKVVNTGVTRDSHYCVWAIKQVGANKTVAGTSYLAGSL
jgi:hypothetical protein